MKIIIVIFALTLSFLIAPTWVSAQQKQQGQGFQTQDTIQDSNTPEETVVTLQGNQVQNQVKTQNAGEESQLKVNTQESLQGNEDSQSRSETARQNMSNVAQKVEELLNNDRTQGIGQQVRIIVQQQKQAQVGITAELNKLESRQGLMKKLIGADQKTIKNLKQQIEQNQLRIQDLQQLQNQAANKTEETQIQELVQALLAQNTALENQIRAEEQTGSIFGWLFKLFN